MLLNNVESYLKFSSFLLKLSFSDTTVYPRWQGKINTAEISVFYSGDIYVTSFSLHKTLFYEK